MLAFTALIRPVFGDGSNQHIGSHNETAARKQEIRVLDIITDIERT